MVDYETYGSLCSKAAEDDEILAIFKQHPHVTYMLEQSSPGSEFFGHRTLDILLPKYGHLLGDLPWEKYRKNDQIGGPVLHDWRHRLQSFASLDSYEFSHTTLRYIFTSLDAITRFGDAFPKCLSVLEIGGGYGGQCKIFMDTIEHFFPDIRCEYTILDLKDPSALQNRYLREIDLFGSCRSVSSIPHGTFDLVISAYCIGEIPLEIQDEYVKKLLLPARFGYLLWNVTDVHPLLYFAEREPELPFFTDGNLLVTWKRST